MAEQWAEKAREWLVKHLRPLGPEVLVPSLAALLEEVAREARAGRDAEWSDALWSVNPEEAGAVDPGEAKEHVAAVVAHETARLTRERDEARAERDAVQDMADQRLEWLRDAERQVERLRAELDRPRHETLRQLADAVERNEHLKAEVERLQAEAASWKSEALRRYDILQTMGEEDRPECERLVLAAEARVRTLQGLLGDHEKEALLNSIDLMTELRDEAEARVRTLEDALKRIDSQAVEQTGDFSAFAVYAKEVARAALREEKPASSNVVTEGSTTYVRSLHPRGGR